MKEIGVLLPIFSLPTKYGIGDFGYEAYKFIDILSENNIDYWEILPINACDRLPYSPISYYALNTDYISLDKLKEMSLIENVELRPESNRVCYDRYKEKYYKEAYYNFKNNYLCNNVKKINVFKDFKDSESFEEFKKNSKIVEYAEFMNKKTEEDVEYYIFLQFLLDIQWNDLKKYANSKRVKIIEDMPIYPTFDSVEVKNYSRYFELEDGQMKYVAGTPADEYNKNGQNWGNPTYNFETMKEDNYTYFIERYTEYLKRYDKIRIDHFRAYDSYYKIPVDGEHEGYYDNGPSYNFFDKLLSISTKDRYIIEDLGDIRKETIDIIRHYNLTRQKIFQFTVNLDYVEDNDTEEENMVLYPENHDCSTLMGWYNCLDDYKKHNLYQFLKKNDCEYVDICKGIIEYCLKSKQKIIIIPVQDILGLDDSSRINIPGIESENNWSWKLQDFNELERKINILNIKKI